MKNLNKDIGSYAESLAQKFLTKHGYKILDCNFRNALGEIDIICTKNKILIVAEVKSRYSNQYGTPREAVSYLKQKSIIKVTRSYIIYKKMHNINLMITLLKYLI